MWHYYDNSPGWLPWTMGVGLVLLLALLLAVIVVGVRMYGAVSPRHAPSPPQADSAAARAILDERLARGEMSVEEYQSRRAALDQGAPR